MYIYIPPTLQQDFEAVLQSDLAQSYTVNFDPLHVIRAILYESRDTRFKSPDNSFLLRAGLNSNIQKGDYISLDTDVYLVVWTVNERLPNSIKSRVQRCNVKLNINRWYDTGYLPVVSNVWCVVFNGARLDFSFSNGDVGIVPSNNVSVVMQYNSNTQQIQIGDAFNFYGNSLYKIIDLDYTQLNPDGVSGLLIITAQKGLAGV